MDRAAKLAQAAVEAWDMAHRGPFGISSESWAIVLATFAGPIVAILITLRRDASAKILERRLWVFRTLLATRGQFVGYAPSGWMLGMVERRNSGKPQSACFRGGRPWSFGLKHRLQSLAKPKRGERTYGPVSF
jgi:hypothetical protein